MTSRAIPAYVCLAVLLVSSVAQAQPEMVAERVASGLSRPVFVTTAPGDATRLFIVEQRSGSTGRIKILNLNTGTVNATPFLSISGLSTGSEQGLLGLAFHPNYQKNGLFYVKLEYVVHWRRYRDPRVCPANAGYRQRGERADRPHLQPAVPQPQWWLDGVWTQ